MPLYNAEARRVKMAETTQGAGKEVRRNQDIAY